jgi:uncharacterized phiE125 gp8 family phage protein
VAWEVTTPRDEEPVLLGQVRMDLRLDGDGNEEDALLEDLIKEVTDFVELTLNRALLPQTWRQYLPAFPDGVLHLTGAPFTAIDSIKYRDPNGDEQTLSPEAYIALLAEPARIEPVEDWPDTADRIDAVEITVSAGYENADAVPGPIKRAIRALVAHHFRHREPVVMGAAPEELPLHVQHLLFPYRDGSLI